MNLPLPTDLARLLDTLPVLRRAYLVGGCVRDALLGRALKDFDIEAFDVDYEQLAAALAPFGRVDLVGRSFGVIKLALGGAIHDIGIPRRDSKRAPGHRGFAIEFDPAIEPRDAAARRDFTINSMMFDPRRGELLDFFGGQADLERRILRHTSDAFVEDPLRVLRGMQFAGRFDLVAAPGTVDLCRTIAASYAELPLDRVREEWLKWATRSARPSAGIRFLEASGWIAHYPELAALRQVPQDPEWHPEGDVLEHTCHCLDALVALPAWSGAEDATRAVLMFAVLTHDFGKTTCTRVVPGEPRPRITSPGHDVAGGPLAASFLARIAAPNAILEHVQPLVLNHMAHFDDPSPRAVRRLSQRLRPETIERLCTVMAADALGRPPRPPIVPESIGKLRAAAEALDLASRAPRPILLGRHLVQLGFHPGRDIGLWTRRAFEAQLDGAFHDLDGARRWLGTQLDFPLPGPTDTGHRPAHHPG